MNTNFDTIIAGAGLAGASAAMALAKSGQRVCILDRSEFASGASGSGLALVSPMMSRKGRPVWKVREALDRLGRTDTGLLRPASSLDQATYFKESSLQNPDLGTWIEPAKVGTRFPYVKAPFGLVHVHRGYAVDLATLTKSWIQESVELGSVAFCHVAVQSWVENQDCVRVLLSNGQSAIAERLLLATGPDLVNHPETQHLNLHPIKGQRLRLKKPEGWFGSILPISGAGFVMDEGQTLSIGATFEHDWQTEGPTEEGKIELLNQAAEMIDDIHDMDVVEHVSGIRVTVPGTRMPMIGPLPNCPRIWVFTGLGSKGVLMASLLGMKIPDFFNNFKSIPMNCRVAMRTPKA
jgi:glycine/D-amino acid oxidase-like deaminating enzyme